MEKFEVEFSGIINIDAVNRDDAKEQVYDAIAYWLPFDPNGYGGFKNGGLDVRVIDEV
jgi:hypothetical protein